MSRVVAVKDAWKVFIAISSADGHRRRSRWPEAQSE
jgi:hypothetical protein